MQNYKDLKVWAKAHQLTLAVYKATKKFPKEEVYSLTSQVRRSSSSIPANIAEGCGRRTKNDFANFLQIALGSANETEYLMFLSMCLEYIEKSRYEEIEKTVNEVKAMLISLIDKVRNSK